MGIYIPSLGVTEINRNEFRRIDPAITMIETGNWKIPVLGGKEYFKKPPLINWLIASSFVLTGERNEFTARLPSALFVLFFVTFLILCPSGWLNLETRLISSLLYMTTASIIGKGLISEIESSYISLAGISILCWLNLWSLNSSRGFLWTFPAVFLGIGLLLKGPIVLFFYYLTVICVLVSFKEIKKLFSLQHFAGILIMSLIFLSWAYSSYKSSSTGSEMTGTWSEELTLQFKTGGFEQEKWLQRIIGSFANLAPWLVFIPFFFKAKTLLANEKKYLIFKSCIISIIRIYSCKPYARDKGALHYAAYSIVSRSDRSYPVRTGK